MQTLRPKYSGGTETERASAVSIYEDLNRMQGAPKYFPPYTAATLPPVADPSLNFHAIFITDTKKPAWLSAAETPAVWRYADGSAV